MNSKLKIFIIILFLSQSTPTYHKHSIFAQKSIDLFHYNALSHFYNHSETNFKLDYHEDEYDDFSISDFLSSVGPQKQNSNSKLQASTVGSSTDNLNIIKLQEDGRSFLN